MGLALAPLKVLVGFNLVALVPLPRTANPEQSGDATPTGLTEWPGYRMERTMKSSKDKTKSVLEDLELTVHCEPPSRDLWVERGKGGLKVRSGLRAGNTPRI
jgi:hypothetical protein